MDISTAPPLLELEDITVRYGKIDSPSRPAVDRTSLFVGMGEITGLVGESGSGKTTLGLVAAGIIPPDKGSVRFAGRRIDTRSGTVMRQHRLDVQMVFQDPAGSLNPRMTIGEILDEVLYVHRVALTLKTAADRAASRDTLLDAVGLARNMTGRYPHALSGGQRQRVGIARALAVKPRLLVADEPVSALDVSVQVQILNLIKSVNERLGQACLFVAHDLAVVRYMCSRAYVMEAGRIVESGPCDQLFAAPAHPYTQKLLSAVPDVEIGLQKRRRLQRMPN